MGIGYREIIPLINTLNKLDGKDDISLCELGNNYLKGDEMIPWLESEGYNFTIGGEQHPTGVVSKTFWNRLGFNHTSIDMNGLDGSLPYDLREDISDKFNTKFDVIYDGGTGEHVDNQYMCFKNIHNITKTSGMMIHVLPKVGHFPKHCSYYYTIETFEVLYELCGYKILELFEHDAWGGTMIYTTLEKNDNEFITEEEFKKVPIEFVDEFSHDRNLYPYAYK